MRYNSQSYSAQNVSVGGYNLSPRLIGMISGSENILISHMDFSQIPNTKIAGEKVYVGEGSIQEPKIGDLLISFSVVRPKTVSIIGKQDGIGFIPHISSNSKEILMLKSGTQSAQKMFTAAMSSNKTMGWILRLVGIVLIMFGFNLILKPLVVLVDVLPFLGSMVGFGTGIVSFLLGISIGFVTIAVAWIAYRPLVGIPLLVIAVAIIFYIIRKGAIKKEVSQTSS